MKPKTKLQKNVVKLADEVEPITNQQKQWANKALFGGYYVRCRRRNYCLECGHKWNPKEASLSFRILKPTCPACGAKKLDHIDSWNADEIIYDYWAVVDIVEGFQVVRMFFAEKYLKRNQPATFFHQEVMQHWIREDGKITSLTKRCNAMGAYTYYDSWTKESKLEVRTPSQNHQLRCSISPTKICPGRETLRIIRRNGYKGYFKKQPPHQFFSAILKYPKAETLLKANQISLFKRCVRGKKGIDGQVTKHWESICIALRNNYIVDDGGLWLDYLDMLDRFGKDLNSAHYVCPQDLKKEHNRYNQKINEINRKRRLEENKKTIKQASRQYIENKKMFFDLKFRNGSLNIVPLKSVEEFLVEASKLNHCLFNNDYYKKDDSLILSARIDGEPIETVEVDLNQMEVVQARGVNNQATPHHELIVGTLQNNMGKIARCK